MKQQLLKILYKFLAFCARIYLWRTKPFVIGVTGSVGKTCCRDIVTQVLNQVQPSSQPSPSGDKGETEGSDNFEVEAKQKEKATNDTHVALLSSKGEEIQRGGNLEGKMKDYAVVGHCCESSDIITSKLYDAETIETRKLPKANIGDILVIDGGWSV